MEKVDELRAKRLPRLHGGRIKHPLHKQIRVIITKHLGLELFLLKDNITIKKGYLM